MIEHQPGGAMCEGYRYRCHPSYEPAGVITMPPDPMDQAMTRWQWMRFIALWFMGVVLIVNVVVFGASYALLPVGCLFIGLPSFMRATYDEDEDEEPRHPSLDRSGAGRPPDAFVIPLGVHPVRQASAPWFATWDGEIARVEHEVFPDGMSWSKFRHDPRCPTCHGVG